MARECFNCVNYHPDQHEGWAPENEGRYRIYHLGVYLRSVKMVVHSQNGWPGSCERDPVPVPVRSIYCCASWAGNADNAWLGMKDSRSFSLEQDFYRENNQLKAELKKERKRSLERFRQLKKKT